MRRAVVIAHPRSMLTDEEHAIDAERVLIRQTRTVWQVTSVQRRNLPSPNSVWLLIPGGRV